MDSKDCRLCCDYVKDDPTHKYSPTHHFNFMLFQWNNYRKALVSDRHGCKVSIISRESAAIFSSSVKKSTGQHCFKITTAAYASLNNRMSFDCAVKNERRKSNVLLTSAMIIHPYKLFSMKNVKNMDVNLENDCAIELAPGIFQNYIIKFSSGNTIIGSFEIPLFFNFQTLEEKPDTFTIIRTIDISIEEELLQNPAGIEFVKSPFTSNPWSDDTILVNPTKPGHIQNQYPIRPDWQLYLRLSLEKFPWMTTVELRELSVLKKHLEPGYLTVENYRNFWHIVLWLEEIGQVLGLSRYNMEKVTIEKISQKCLRLQVPGLAEKRPSVIVGDFVDLKLHNHHTGYRGIITSVNAESVDIEHIHNEFLKMLSINPNCNKEIDVKFVVSRLSLERMHQAVDQIYSNELLPSLFPNKKLLNKPVPEKIHITESDFHNKTVAGNPEQRTAVQKILNMTSGAVPYIVFGPPGTGKTVTIVESILQLKEKTKKKILVCAPANAACNLLTEKLIQGERGCKKNELIRIMSQNVDVTTVNKNVLEYSNYEGNGEFTKIIPEELLKYRIIVTTLILIGRYTRRYHPDVVFVDEAAQACEPEVNCAIAMLDKGKQIVLAGDPQQLGPNVVSKVSRNYSLDKSLLERLMEYELYQSGDSNFLTMLKLNFRSHSTILKLSNELFYSNKLMATSFESENDPVARVFVFERIQELFRKQTKKVLINGLNLGSSVEFCSVISKESKQGSSPSYFNEKEVQMVLKYIQALFTIEFKDKEKNVKQEHIGVITPYARQVHKVREILKKHNFENIEVGTTETFQGREKRIIILTTVRAKKDLLLYDKQYNLGFVKHDKRFNVALTRAMSKLIVIGCAHVLATDTKWLKYIEMCEDLKSFCGAPFARRTKDAVDYINKQFGKFHSGNNEE